jgi:hypothetical protein
MIGEHGNFRELILKPSMVDRVRGARPLSGRISRTPLQPTESRKDRWVISVDRIARNARQSAKLGDRRALASSIGAIASFEKSERLAESRAAAAINDPPSGHLIDRGQ